MAVENDKAVFSLRLPRNIAEQIDRRALVNRRPRNSEIVLLLEIALDLGVQRDLEILRKTKEAKDLSTLET